MAKFKFKGTTTEDVEEELERLCKIDVTEIPLNHIKRVISVIGVVYVAGQNSGSQVRFQHPDAETPGHFFGVHRVHKGKAEELVRRRDFKQYLMPQLQIIIAKRKAKRV